MANPNPPAYNKKMFENLLKIQCTEKELLAVFSTNRHTLQRWVKETYEGMSFADVSKNFREAGKASLRRTLFQLAERKEGVAIFLAKNYLGMSDVPVPQDTGEERKEFENAIKTASRALASADISKLAQVPQQDNDHEQNQDKEI